VKVLFAASAAEAFAELPEAAKKRVASTIELLEQHPRMCPVRRRGLMRGYRYFVAGKHLFYYSLSSQEVRITAIIPGVMRRA
jgi:plasmid stabilization system protein ParE